MPDPVPPPASGPVRVIEANGIRIATRSDGPGDGPVLLMAHALGLDHRVFDAVLPHLPAGLRIVRYDARGHGATEVPDPPYRMGRLIGDAEAVCDALGLRDVVMLGLSMGGLTALGLAVKRPDLVRALVLSNTAPRIGNAAVWQDRIAAIEAGGIGAIVGPTLDRWFAPDFPGRAAWGDRLRATPVAGYLGTCAALAQADLREVASGLALPALCIAGSHDGSTPPDLVREMADTIPQAEFVLLRRAGHLPCVDHPEAHGAAIAGFLSEIG